MSAACWWSDPAGRRIATCRPQGGLVKRGHQPSSGSIRSYSAHPTRRTASRRAVALGVAVVPQRVLCRLQKQGTVQVQSENRSPKDHSNAPISTCELLGPVVPWAHPPAIIPWMTHHALGPLAEQCPRNAQGPTQISAPISVCRCSPSAQDTSTGLPQIWRHEKGQSLRRRGESITPIGCGSNLHRLTHARSQMRPCPPGAALCPVLKKKELEQPPSARKETFRLAVAGQTAPFRPRFLRWRGMRTPRGST
jgi:hypothetical protein